MKGLPPEAPPVARAPPAWSAAPRRGVLEKPEGWLDQRRPVLTDVVDRIRNLRHGQLVGWDEQLHQVARARTGIEPGRLGVRHEDYRHAVVDRRDHLPRSARHDRAGMDRSEERRVGTEDRDQS